MAWIYLNYFRNYNGSKYWKFLNKTLRILIFFQVDSFTSIFDIDVKELETQTLLEQFQQSLSFLFVH